MQPMRKLCVQSYVDVLGELSELGVLLYYLENLLDQRPIPRVLDQAQEVVLVQPLLLLM